jgi:GPH family glycoside/pentoside/hexuronide:cation symporter
MNVPFIVVMGVKLSNLFASAVQAAITPFLFLHVLDGSYRSMSYYFLVRAAAMLFAQPLWLRSIGVLGEKTSYHVAGALFILVICSWLLAGPHEGLLPVLLRAGVTGIATGGVLLIGQMLLPQVIDYDYRRTGLRREGVFSGVYIMVEKVSAALGIAAVGLILGWYGYEAGGATIQSSTAISGIWICLLLPAPFQALASIVLLFFKPSDGVEPRNDLMVAKAAR